MRSSAVRDKLTELIRIDRQGKRICLACFCPDETLCHRSIVAGILQYAGIPVNGVKDDRYSSGAGHQESPACHPHALCAGLY